MPDTTLPRLADDGTSVLASPITANGTSLPLVAGGWAVDAGQFPLDVLVGGERITVGSVTGTTVQTLSGCIRSVNGVVKAHAAGAIVEVARRMRVTLGHAVSDITPPSAPPPASGITLVGISDTLYTGTNVTNIDVPYPSVSGGILANDHAEIYVCTQEGPTAAQPNTPSGWTLRGDTGVVNVRTTKFYDTMAGGESGNVNVAWASGTPRPYACMLIWRGVNTTTPYDVAHQIVTGSADPNPSAITPVTNGAVVTVMCAGNKTPPSSATISAGYTANVDQDAQFRGLVGCHKLLATAAAEDPAAYSWAIDSSTAWTDALRPA